MPRKICPKCKSHESHQEGNDMVCNICDTTIDFMIEGLGWAGDATPCNIVNEARMYNQQFKHHQTVIGRQHNTRHQA